MMFSTTGDHAPSAKNLGDDLAEGKPRCRLSARSPSVAAGSADRGAVKKAGGLADFRPCSPPWSVPAHSTTRRASAEAESRRAIACLDALCRLRLAAKSC
jgi:hypothetical protein